MRPSAVCYWCKYTIEATGIKCLSLSYDVVGFYFSLCLFKFLLSTLFLKKEISSFFFFKWEIEEEEKNI